VNLGSLSNEEKRAVIKAVATVLVSLHASGLSHLRIKPSSVFRRQKDNSFHIGCLCARPVVDWSPEDSGLPFEGQSDFSCDVFLFGCLIIECFTNLSQVQILEDLWKPGSGPKIVDDLYSFGEKCISLDPAEKPTLEAICDFFHIQPVTIPVISKSELEDLLINDLREIEYLTLLRGFVLSQRGDDQGAMIAYERLSECAIAINNRAKLLLAKEKSPASVRQAVQLFVRAADAGYAVAQINAALAFEKGLGVEADPVKKMEYLRMAAEQGHVEAMGHYSMALRPDFMDLSALFLRTAARKLDPRALHAYAIACNRGMGLPGDSKMDYYRAGALNGYIECMNNYAINCSVDSVANEWWRKAAEKGFGMAQFNLAVSYKIGRGVPQDDVKAAYWMRLAAEQKVTSAMFDYAIMLRDGIGVKRDVQGAEKMCLDASRQREYGGSCGG
jgi:TPR repeat protein